MRKMERMTKAGAGVERKSCPRVQRQAAFVYRLSIASNAYRMSYLEGPKGRRRKA